MPAVERFIHRKAPTRCNSWWQGAARSTRSCGINAVLEIPVAEPIAIASDHAAVELKAQLVEHLLGRGFEVTDLGPASCDSVDYPDFGYKLADALASGEAAFGVALCGSGIGISISVNRHPACRCALVSDGLSARLAREHNDANVIAMGARLIGIETAKDCLDQFLSARVAGGRHAGRVAKLSNPVFTKENA
jgi:ribose 5-phosphate isomerase B